MSSTGNQPPIEGEFIIHEKFPLKAGGSPFGHSKQFLPGISLHCKMSENSKRKNEGGDGEEEDELDDTVYRD